jgi:hypothetical protein
MALYERTRKRARGSIDGTPSGSLRVRVFAGYDSVSKKRHYLIEWIQPGPDRRCEGSRESSYPTDQPLDERPANEGHAHPTHREAPRRLDPGTLRGFQRNFKNHIQPLIGSTNMGAVAPH